MVENEALDDNDVRIRQRICAEIHESLHSSFPDLDLSMFGSTYNGFGLHLSDVDICLQFKEKPINKVIYLIIYLLNQSQYLLCVYLKFEHLLSLIKL